MPRSSRRDFLRLLGAGAAGLMAGDSALAGPSPAQAKPNILLITTDTLRADACGCYGYPLKTTPFLDSLAKEGVRFDQCIAPSSWTTPSIMTMFTGESPVRHGVVSPEYGLAPSVPTLATELKQLGYHTIGVLCNPCAAGKIGFERGFDLYDDFTVMLDCSLNLFGVGKSSKKKGISRNPTGKEITDLALRYVRKVPKGKPYFLFVLYFDPHADYTPPEEYKKQFADGYEGEAHGDVNRIPITHVYEDPKDLAYVRGLYDAEIRFDDDQLARLLGTLEKEGLYSDKDLFVFTSDHGEEFNEHKGLQHRRTLYEEVVRVPLVMKWPGRLPRGKVVTDLTGHEELMPSLVRAAGGKASPGLSQIDLFALASGKPTPRRASVGMHLHYQDTHIEGIRTPDLAFLRDKNSGKTELFDLRQDPGQKKPLGVEAPGTKTLAAKLDTWLATEAKLGQKASRAGTRTKVKLTKEQMQALKALGYIQ